MNYQKKTDQELRQIAYDLMEGKIICDRHEGCQGEGLLMVFIPLALLDDSMRKELEEFPLGMIYEYVNKAAPVSVNSMPMFLSAKFLDVDDAAQALKYYEEFNEQKKRNLGQ